MMKAKKQQKPRTERRPYQPCIVCGHCVFYIRSGGCVRCAQLKASVNISKTIRELNIRREPKPYRDFRSKESEAMAGVDYT